MVDAAEFIKSARSYFDEQSQVFAAQYLKVKDQYETDERIQTIGRLVASLELTTKSIFLLAEKEYVWDLPILFRSVLEGSARALYLLSASSLEERERRWNEYENILLKAEMANCEQAVNGLAQTSGEGTVDGEVFAIARKTIDKLKTGAGESGYMKGVKGRWSFETLSGILKNECPLWECSINEWKLRHATANSSVHKSSLGNKRALENYRSLRDEDVPSIFMAAPIVDGCIALQFDRLLFFLKELELDVVTFFAVKFRHEDFFALMEEICVESEKAVRKQIESKA